MPIQQCFNVAVVGEPRSGKSALIRRASKGLFLSCYRRTVGVDLTEVTISIDQPPQPTTVVGLCTWEIAGSPAYARMGLRYYADGAAHAVIVAFSTAHRADFSRVPVRVQQLRQCCPSSTSLVLCQTMFDCSPDEDAVTGKEAEALSLSLKLPLFRVSAKDDFNVARLFQFVARLCVEAPIPPSLPSSPMVAAKTRSASPASPLQLQEEHGSPRKSERLNCPPSRMADSCVEHCACVVA